MVEDREYVLADIILAKMLFHGSEVKKQYMQEGIRAECFSYLNMKLNNNQYLNHFDYSLDIDKFGNKVEIVPENIITALWFIGIFPLHINVVLKENTYYYKGFKYTFNKKTKKLKMTEYDSKSNN